MGNSGHLTRIFFPHRFQTPRPPQTPPENPKNRFFWIVEFPSFYSVSRPKKRKKGALKLPRNSAVCGSGQLFADARGSPARVAAVLVIDSETLLRDLAPSQKVVDCFRRPMTTRLCLRSCCELPWASRVLRLGCGGGRCTSGVATRARRPARAVGRLASSITRVFFCMSF